MENVKEERDSNARIMYLMSEKVIKTKLSTAPSRKRKSSQKKSRPTGGGNAQGAIKKDSFTKLESEDDEYSPERKTGIKKMKIGRPRRSNNAMSLESTWSITDRQRLLIALQRFGVLNINELIRAVPGKSEDDIRTYITYKWKLARMFLRNKLKEVRKSVCGKNPYLGPVDRWLNMLYSNFPNYDHYKLNPIAHAVLLVWKYEKHPHPSECGGVDFKALYEHLYYVLAGYPPRHLNQPTARYLQETLKNFAYKYKIGAWTKETQFFDTSVKINTQTRPPVTEEEVDSVFSYSIEECLEKIQEIPGFNPFLIPKELHHRKVHEDMQHIIVVSANDSDDAKMLTVLE